MTITERGTARPPRSGRRGPDLDVFVAGALGILSFVGLWWLGSQTTQFVPSFGVLVAEVPRFLTEEDIWSDIAPSLLRVTGGLLIALGVGLVAAYLMNKGGFAGAIVNRYVDLTIGLPSTIVALLALFILKRSEISPYVVVVIASSPFVAITLRQGLMAADEKLTAMGTIYRYGRWRTMRHVFVPHLVPYSFSAVRNEYAHAWRVVVVAEVFAVNSGIGWRFSQAFDRFNVDDIALWLITFMILLLSTEYLILRPLEKYVLRWRASDR